MYLSGYPEDLETFGTPDTVNITDILSVDVTPLTFISISGMDVISCPDMSFAVLSLLTLVHLCLLILMIGLEKFKILPLHHLSTTPQAPIRDRSEILHQ